MALLAALHPPDAPADLIAKGAQKKPFWAREDSDWRIGRAAGGEGPPPVRGTPPVGPSGGHTGPGRSA